MRNVSQCYVFCVQKVIFKNKFDNHFHGFIKHQTIKPQKMTVNLMSTFLSKLLSYIKLLKNKIRLMTQLKYVIKNSRNLSWRQCQLCTKKYEKSIFLKP